MRPDDCGDVPTWRVPGSRPPVLQGSRVPTPPLYRAPALPLHPPPPAAVAAASWVLAAASSTSSSDISSASSFENFSTSSSSMANLPPGPPENLDLNPYREQFYAYGSEGEGLLDPVWVLGKTAGPLYRDMLHQACYEAGLTEMDDYDVESFFKNLQ